MREEGGETEKNDWHVLWQGGLQSLLQNRRACDVASMLGEDKSQLKIWAETKTALSHKGNL